MVTPVNTVIQELNQISGVEAEKLGGAHVDVGRETTIRYTVLVTFENSSERTQNAVRGVYRSIDGATELQTDDGWGKDKWAILVSNSQLGGDK